MAAGWGLVPLGAAVPVGVRVGVHQLSVCLASSGLFSAWCAAALAGWAAGSDGPRQGVKLSGASSWVVPWAALPAGGSNFVGSAGAGARVVWLAGSVVGVRPGRGRGSR